MKSRILLFLIWPIASLVFELKNLTRTQSIFFLLLFSIFFGWNFIHTSVYLSSNDAIRYITVLRDFHSQNLTFEDFRLNYLVSEVDYVRPILTYIVSIFSNRANFLFMIFSVFFGYFYFKILQLLLTIKGEFAFVELLIIIMIAFNIPLWEINAFRFWSAALVFILSVIYFIENKYRSALFLLIFTPFIHFSFWILVFVFIIFYIVRKNINTIFTGLLISSILPLEVIRSATIFSLYIPEKFQVRTELYLDVDFLSKQINTNWYITLVPILLKYLTFFLLVMSFIEYRKGRFTEKMMIFFAFVMIFRTFSNLLADIFEGDRFLTISSSLILIFIFIYSNSLSFMKLKIINWPLFFIFFFIIIIKVREGMDFFGLNVILGNPLIILLNQDDIPLIAYIK